MIISIHQDTAEEGDKHLLKIKHYENFKIMKLSDFLMLFA